MSAVTAAAFFLFMAIGGSSDGGTLSSVGIFPDQKSCDAAKVAIQAALKDASSTSGFACVGKDAVDAFSKAGEDDRNP